MSKKSRGKRQDEAKSQPATVCARPQVAPLRMILVFTLLVGGGHLLQVWLLDLTPLQRALAWLVAQMLSLIGVVASVQGTELFLPAAHWDIVADCTGFPAMILYAAFLMAYPCRVRDKWVGLGIGVPLLLLVNILRLVALGWLTEVSPRFAAWCHDFIWQVGMLFIVVAMWLLWCELVVGRADKTVLSD